MKTPATLLPLKTKAAGLILDADRIVLMSPSLKSINEYPISEIRSPLLITLGKYDPPVLRKRALSVLIPALRSRGLKYQIKDDFPGDHKWFWKVHQQYWRYVVSFLNHNS